MNDENKNIFNFARVKTEQQDPDTQALVVKLQKLCQQKDDTHAALKAQLQQQAQEMQAMRARMGDLDGKAAQLQQTLLAKDAELSHLRTSLQEPRAQIQQQADPLVKKEPGLFSFAVGRASRALPLPGPGHSPDSASFRTPEAQIQEPKSPFFCTPFKHSPQSADQIQNHRLGLGKVVAKNEAAFKLHHYGRTDASKKLFMPLVDQHGYPLISQRPLDSSDVVTVFEQLASARPGGGGYLPNVVAGDVVSRLTGTPASTRNAVPQDEAWEDDES
ncbi:hypothetical protein WJX72_011535 [[Myrmecia] bisecta]|uniref:Uncharacterized protein n=1 Tax=[Myrmecia] bisecta TaxID=41462 RepID=A0AAW1Q220_9CHLO